MTRQDAVISCNELGGYDLASIHCDDQMNEISNLIKKKGSNKMGYIGYKFGDDDDLEILFDDGTKNDYPSSSSSSSSIQEEHHWIIAGDANGDNVDLNKYPECIANSNNHGIARNEYGNNIGITCCNSNGIGSRPDCDVDRPDPATYDEAVNFCQNNGNLRLCTKEEIESGSGKGEGCNYDAYHVWTSTQCDPLLDTKPDSYYIVAGNYQSYKNQKPTECAVYSKNDGIASIADHGNDIGVTCCDENGIGSRPDCDADPATYDEAVNVCKNNGNLRLCTKTEIENGSGKGGGCSFDAYHVWTSTQCTDINIAPSHWIIVGNFDSNNNIKPRECTLNNMRNGIANDGTHYNQIGVTCCDENGIGSRPDCDANPANYYEAENICNKNGLRLCSRYEIETGSGKAGGCSFDQDHVWTSTVCNINIKKDESYWIVAGDVINYGTQKQPECTLNDNNAGIVADKIGVTCCDSNGIGSRPDCDADPATYDEAVTVCKNNGDLRVCTKEEIENGAGDGTGCSFDLYHVWTSTKCDTNIDCVAINGDDNSWNQINCEELKYPICNNRPINIINTCSTLSPSSSPTTAQPTPSPTDISLPTNKHDLFCGANNDKPTWAAILSLDQTTLNLLQNVKNEDAVKTIMEYIMCTEFVYHIVTKNAAVAGPTTAIKLTNTLLTLLKEIETIEDAVGDTADDISQFIVTLMDILTPDETGIQWMDEWDQDGTIFNPFEKLEALGQFLSVTVCKKVVGDGLNGLITNLADSTAISDIKTAFINNMHTFLNDDNNNLFSSSSKEELLENDGYKDFSFAVTIGMKLCFSKIMTGCITRQHGISINLRGDTQIFESRAMFVEFPVSKIGIASAGYVHFDFLSNYQDVVNKDISMNVGVFANVPGSDKISEFMDLWESHSDKLSDIPFIGDTSEIGVDFIDGVIEDNPLIVDILTGGAAARLSIIYTFTDNDKINCNGFRISLSVGDIDSFGGGVFFGSEYRQNGIGNIQQSMDWIDDIDHAANFEQFGKVIVGLSTELINILDDAVDAIGDEIKEIAEDIVGEAKTQIIAALNEVIGGVEDIANVGVDAVNIGIDGTNTVINGANSAVNSLIDDANTLFKAAISGANSARGSVNSAIDTTNSKITSANSAVSTVKSRFSSANNAINSAKSDCKDVDDECINIGVSVCVDDIINIDSLCNAVFSPISSPMSLLNSAINSIPKVPKMSKISSISNSISLPNIPGFPNIDSIDDIIIADIPNNANQVDIDLNDMIDDYDYNEVEKPDLTITIPSKVTALMIFYTIILGLIGYFCGVIEEKIYIKNHKNNKQYLSVYDTEITDVSDNEC